MKRRILGLILALVTIISLSSCKKEAAHSLPKAEKDPDRAFEEEVVEVIYAKTPQEAADKCMDAIYTGDFSSARQYVLQEGNAKAEIVKFRSSITKSLDEISKGVSKEKTDKLLQNTFGEIKCQRTGTKEDGDSATVSYLISIPDMGSINYSAYMDKYIASLGMSMEEFMTHLETMTAEESQKWSVEISVDLLNYIFESEENLSRTESHAEVITQKSESGWIVTEINISQK